MTLHKTTIANQIRQLRTTGQFPSEVVEECKAYVDMDSSKMYMNSFFNMAKMCTLATFSLVVYGYLSNDIPIAIAMTGPFLTGLFLYSRFKNKVDTIWKQ